MIRLDALSSFAIKQLPFSRHDEGIGVSKDDRRGLLVESLIVNFDDQGSADLVRRDAQRRPRVVLKLHLELRQAQLLPGHFTVARL